MHAVSSEEGNSHRGSSFSVCNGRSYEKCLEDGDGRRNKDPDDGIDHSLLSQHTTVGW